MKDQGVVATPRLCQISICTANAALSQHFYATLLGLRYTGCFKITGATAAHLLELVDVDAVNHWMAGSPDFFQLELFEFREPRSTPCLDPNVQGYDRVIVAVDAVDAAIRRLEGAGISVPLERHCEAACIRDPDGVLLELQDTGGESAWGRVVGVRLVVADATDAVRFFHALGLSPAEIVEPTAGAVSLAAGDYWIEIVQEPRKGAMRLLTEHGLMNIALGLRRPSDFAAIYNRVLAAGFTSSTPPLSVLSSNVVYLRSRAGVSVELIQLPAWMDVIWGFRAPGILSRAVQGMIRILSKMSSSHSG